MNHLYFAVSSKLHTVSPRQISILLHFGTQSRTPIENYHSYAEEFLQALLKKLDKIQPTDLTHIFANLKKLRIGNRHYYELLIIQLVKFLSTLELDSLIPILESCANANCSSSGLVSSFCKVLKPKLLLETGRLLGDSSLSPVGLIGKDELQSLKYQLFPSLRPPRARKELLISDLYRETRSVLFDFPLFIDLCWSLLVLSENSGIACLDSATFILLHSLLFKHLEHFNKTDTPISYLTYEKLTQIKCITAAYFPTFSPISIPKQLQDYRYHVAPPSALLIPPQLKQEDLKFVRALAKHCKREGLVFHVPPSHFSGSFAPQLILPTGMIPNLFSREPHLVCTARETLNCGNYTGLFQKKVQFSQLPVLTASSAPPFPT